MRVVYFVSLFPCWSETFIVRELHELMRLGVDVRIVSLKDPEEKLVQSDAQALLDRVSYPVRGWRGAWNVLRAVAGRPWQTLKELAAIVGQLIGRPEELAKSLVVWWRALALAPVVRGLRPDHLHAHWATYPSTAAMFVSQRIGVPFSFTAHAHDIFLHDHLLARKIRTAAFGVTISEFNVRFLAERLRAPVHERLRIVHCGVTPAEIPFRPDGREPGLILAVGRLDEIKGFRHLVDACVLLQAWGVPFQCLVIGEGRLRGALEQQIAAHGLQERVHLPGACRQEEVREHLYRASVFALPSVVTDRGDRDGIPVALMEAMASGAPVVSTRVSGIPELVEHEVSGLLVPPGDAESLARALQRLLTEPALGARLAHHARQTVERDFDVAKEARKLYEAFA
ncbi:glycosyltransferase [Caldimonas thermodepolymerans]|uniref:glycosyltransferase n=1 Tax=Caldimonas thermodepolymerans TaxID=215580 RepID=UPI0022367B0F|nr:glycosyltransferase [Caldimonas thermodepolymerans]UZG45803.1 glycosyltransferase [Caldimonas thermodepolymerans]